MIKSEIQVAELAEKKTKKLYCANCVNCKLVRLPIGNGSQYHLRVRCAAGKWQKKNGEEKYHKYFTLGRRTVEECEHYLPMGDAKSFLKELKANLPTKDEVYGEQEQ